MDARIVDEDVQAVRAVVRQPGGEPLEQPVQRTALAEPGPHRERPPAGLADQRHGLRGGLAVAAVVDRDQRPLGAEPQGDRAPDPARAAGDQCGPAVQFPHDRLSPPCCPGRFQGRP